MCLTPISSPGVRKGNVWLLICLKRLHSPSRGLERVLISFPLCQASMRTSHSNTPFGSKVCSAAKLLSFSHRVEKGLEEAWRGPLAHSSTIRQDGLHLHTSGQTFSLVLTISHVRSSTSPIQSTSENRPVVQPSLAVKLTTSQHVSHSYKRQFIPLCYCPTLDIWRPLMSPSLLYGTYLQLPTKRPHLFGSAVC